MEDGLVAHDERKYVANTSNDILDGAEGLCGENKSISDSKTSDNGLMENNYRYENKKNSMMKKKVPWKLKTQS